MTLAGSVSSEGGGIARLGGEVEDMNVWTLD
jgi:hypothetical protein